MKPVFLRHVFVPFAGCAALLAGVALTVRANPSFAARPIPPNKLTAAEALTLLVSDPDPIWRHELATPDSPEPASIRATRRLWHGDPGKKQIALTFDDGPHPSATPALLSILRERRVPAAFFVVGEMAERYPELLRAQSDAGMTIGNHTFHHVSLPKIPASLADDEIRACGDVIASITGHRPRWFRPPGGQSNRRIDGVSGRLGYTTALWSDDPGDYAKLADDALLRRTLAHVHPGGILLLHDGPQSTIRILPALVDAIRAQGYTFVSLDTMAR